MKATKVFVLIIVMALLAMLGGAAGAQAPESSGGEGGSASALLPSTTLGASNSGCATGSSYDARCDVDHDDDIDVTDVQLTASKWGSSGTWSIEPHDHWGESWTGTGTGLSLSGGTTGLSGSGSTYGVYGYSSGYGVYGESSGSGTGVRGYNTSNGTAVDGWSTSGTGVSGSSTNGYGVAGSSTNSFGVYGSSTNSFGVYGSSTTDIGVYGTTNSIYAGTAAVQGVHSGGGYGVIGEGGIGVHGAGNTDGVWGLSTDGHGVEGDSSGGHGVDGTSIYNHGVYGESSSGSHAGVRGENPGGGPGVSGTSTSGTGVYGASTSGYGVYGTSSSHFAGFFSGDVHITGNLSKGSGSFKIDHPLDPENQYLYHSFVESPDMMNVYNGNVILDEHGEARVELPDWFEALNKDFRYQLTPIGAPGPNLYIAQEVTNNRFQIAGGTPGMKVSWQVTGIRHDPYAEANRIPVEEAKPPEEQGTYLHPGAYDQPETKGLDYKEPQGGGR